MNQINTVFNNTLEKITSFAKNFTNNPLILLFIFFSITFIRTFFENFSNPEPTSGFTPWYTLHGYILFYICVVLSLSLFLSLFLKEKPFFITKLNILFFPVIVIAPIIDLIISKGSGFCMAYVAHNGTNLLNDFLTFFGPFTGCGISPGIRIEIIFILLGIGSFVLYLTRKIYKSLIAVFFSYLIIFINLAVPGIIITIFGNFSNEVNANVFFGEMFSNSLLSNAHTFIPQSSFLSGFFEQISIFMSRIPWLFSLLLLIVIFYRENKEKTLIFLRDLRITRILYYCALSVVGMFIAFKIYNFSEIPSSLPDIFGLIIFFLLVALNFTLAVVINDVEDIESDKISNPHRPLITGVFNNIDYKKIALVLSFFLISGSLLFNYNIFILTIFFQTIFVLYSTKPFRLKRNFMTGSFSMALAGIVAVLSGFYFLSPDHTFSLIPLSILLPIFLTLFVLVNIRDLKDLEGDKIANIKTLPVLFGDKKARLIIGLGFLIISIFAFAFLLKIKMVLAIISVVSGLIFFFLITLFKQKETIFFFLMYIFTVVFLWFI